MMSKIILLFLFLFGVVSVFSQSLSTKNQKAIDLYTEADNYRVRGQFEQAVRLLKQAIEKDKKFEEAYYRLGLTYRSAGDLALSSENLEQALLLTPFPLKQKTYHFLLGDNYLRSGIYEKSRANLDKFLAIEKADKPKIDQAMVWKGQAEYGLAHHDEDLGYQINPLSDSVNIYPMQYFPAITADGQELIFTVRYGRAHDDNEDIFVSRKDNSGKWQKPVSISENINTEYREGACTISEMETGFCHLQIGRA